MTDVCPEYAYRHTKKTRREEVQPARLRVHPKPGPIRNLDQEERRYTPVQLPQAERGLLLLEHGAAADTMALQANDRGVKNVEQGNLVRAFRKFREALDLNPHLHLVHNNIGLLYLEIGDHEQAERHFNKAIASDSNLDATYSNRALLWIELEEYDAACEDLERALALDPEEPMHYHNLGVLFLELGDPESVLECLDTAIELDPDNPMHHHNRGMAQKQIRNLAQDNREFDRTIELADRERFRELANQ